MTAEITRGTAADDTAGPEKMKQYRQRHDARGGKIGRSYIELGEAILRGELRVQDIDGDDNTNMIWNQDYVTQVGQGSLAERKSERLIRSDVGLMLYRKIWEREIMAHAEGRPLKNWRRSEAVIASEDE